MTAPSSGIHWTLWQEFSGLSVTCGWKVVSAERQGGTIPWKSSALGKLFQWKTPPWAEEVHSDDWEAPLCLWYFFYCIEEQPQLKFTLIIKYSERIITGVKIKLAKLYFFLFLLSSSQMLQPWVNKIFKNSKCEQFYNKVTNDCDRLLHSDLFYYCTDSSPRVRFSKEADSALSVSTVAKTLLPFIKVPTFSLFNLLLPMQL